VVATGAGSDEVSLGVLAAPLYREQVIDLVGGLAAVEAAVMVAL